MAFDTEISQYPCILQAIGSIALANGVVNFPSSKIGEVPSNFELGEAQNGAGLPFFAVRQGQWRRWVQGTEEVGGPPDSGMRGIGTVEPVWDFDCYMLWRYIPESNNVPAVTNYDNAATALTVMTKLFSDTSNLQGVCSTVSMSTIHSLGIEYIQIDQMPLTSARFTVGVYEILSQDYHP